MAVTILSIHIYYHMHIKIGKNSSNTYVLRHLIHYQTDRFFFMNFKTSAVTHFSGLKSGSSTGLKWFFMSILGKKKISSCSFLRAFFCAHGFFYYLSFISFWEFWKPLRTLQRLWILIGNARNILRAIGVCISTSYFLYNL